MSTQRKKNKETINNIKVLIRCRPLLEFQNEPAWQISSTNKIQCLHTKSVRQKIDKTSRRSETDIQAKFKQMNFQYEKVYQYKSTSEQIYKQQAREMVQDSLQTNKNLTLMCYGQTCSGKTFTILGEQRLPGLMPCLLRDLMIYKKENQKSCEIKMSYFQIYNESIFDLLVDGGKKNALTGKLKLHQDKKYGWDVAGLRLQSVQHFEDCIRIIEKGQKNRSYASKENHDRSSRSHTIMRIYIQKQDTKFNKTQQIFNILDLAGSQRLSQDSKNPQETASINKSLFQLSNVISKLSANEINTHIPYRDSKLTKLLQSSLRGNAKCVLVFCVSPGVESFNETLSTLRLAKKAKNIEIQVSQLDLMQSWTPLEKQLFETRQKLSKKSSQCQDLAMRLQYVSRQLERLEELAESMQEKCSANLKLMVLLDRENFLIEDLSNNLLFGSFNKMPSKDLQVELKNYQDSFRQSLQDMYENYAADITQLYLNSVLSPPRNKFSSKNQQYLIQIEQTCFKDIILNEPLRNQCKLETVERLIHEMECNLDRSSKQSHLNKEKHQNVHFIDILKQYHQQLLNFLKSERKSCQSFSRIDHSLNLDDTRRPNQIDEIQQISFKTQPSQSKTLYAWGCSKDGRVFKGNQALPGINLISNQTYGVIKKIKTSYNHNLFFNQEGKLFGWGKNNFNQISHKDTPFHSLPREIKIKQKITSIATGWGHSLALTQTHKAYTWGYGQNGQLGHGNLQNTTKPKLLQIFNQWVEAFAGHSHSGLLDSQGHLYMFGFNKDYRCMIKSESEFIATPAKVLIGNIKTVSLGVSHSVILTNDGYAFCGGIGTNGEFGKQLTLDIPGCQFIEVESRKFQTNDDRYQKVCPLIQLSFQSQVNQQIYDIKCGQNTTYILTTIGNLYICGKNSNKKHSQNIYEPKLLLQKVSSFSVGNRHGFAFSANKNQVFGWGFNMYNQLGNNKEKDIIVPEVVTSVSGLDLVEIECGFIHTIALGK